MSTFHWNATFCLSLNTVFCIPLLQFLYQLRILHPFHVYGPIYILYTYSNVFFFVSFILFCLFCILISTYDHGWYVLIWTLQILYAFVFGISLIAVIVGVTSCFFRSFLFFFTFSMYICLHACCISVCSATQIFVIAILSHLAVWELSSRNVNLKKEIRKSIRE